MHKLKFVIIMVVFFSLLGKAAVFTPEQIKNPNIADRSQYVADPGGYLSVSAKNEINSILYNLRTSTSAEVGLAIIPDIGDMPDFDFATRLFENWQLGKKDKDNGLLIMIVPEQRVARIVTGYGLEGVIPDISARQIIQRSIVPYMKKNDINGASVAVVKDVANIISDPVAAEELKSSQKDKWNELPESDITGEDILNLVGVLIVLVFLISIGVYIYDARRLKKMDRYRQALAWHNKRSSYILMAIGSLGLGLIPFLLAERKYRKARNNPMKCPTCRGKMIKLNEEDDNALLSPQQDFEEKINTVDYDVWVCEDCGTVERYPFKVKQLKYEECPNCHTIAMCLVRDHTLQPATSQRAGMGERIYECQYCHNRLKRRYTIPKRADGAAAAIAAGAILGSGRGGGGFGGGIGGGFGGGSTGGGGAGGRW